MTVAIVTLLVSTLTTVGLVALWAATSSQHWFVRAAVFLGFISPLLLMRAYAPCVALAIEGATIAVGVSLWRRSQARRAATGATTFWPSFSISSLLAAITLTGVGLTLVVRREDLNDGWQSVGVIGLGSAAAVLAGAWVATLRGGRAWIGALASLSLSLGLAAIASRADWFAPSLVRPGIGWPPDEVRFSTGSFFAPTSDLALWMWYAILPLVIGLTLVVVRLTFASGDGRAARAVLTGASLIVTIPAFFVAFKMALPGRIPQEALPQDNAYGDLLDAEAVVGKIEISRGVNFHNCDPYYISNEDLMSSLEKATSALKRAHVALDKPCVMRIDYRDAESRYSHFHVLAQAFVAEGQLAKLNGDRERELDCYLDAIRVGYAARRGGLMSHAQPGATVSGQGVFAIKWILDDLRAEQCVRVAKRLEQIESDAEPFDAILPREYLSQVYSGGWHGRLVEILRNLSEPNRYENDRQGFLMSLAKMQLLKAHLWLRAYRAEHEEVPQSWQQVRDAGLPELPVDPWDPRGGPLRYKLTSNSPVIYSVGPNGVDDGGATPPNPTFSVLLKSGDYTIDMFGRN
jgi:hypothetical protein